MGAVAEAFGVACAELRDTVNAIAWYRAAVGATDGSATFRAAEQLGDQLVRYGEGLSDDTAARACIAEGLGHLARVAALQPTAERESLLGAGYKRLAMVEGRKPANREACLAALKQMAAHCAKAEDLASAAGAVNQFYPAKNFISAELRMAWIEGRTPRGLDARLVAVRDSLAAAAATRPDFWSVVGQTEIKVLAALRHGRLADLIEPTLATLRELKERVPAVRMWDSVCNEARFTLLPYQAFAGAAEAKAAKQLLALLTEFAGR